MSTEPLVLQARDARGVVTLTLNRPQAFNALSEGMLAALQHELDALACGCLAARVRGARRRRQGVLRRPRSASEMRAQPSLDYYQRLFGAVPRMMLTLAAPAHTGDRARAWHRHRRRLPAGGAVRSGGRLERGALRRERGEPGAVLLDARGAAVAQRVAQAGVRDAGHRGFIDAAQARERGL